MKRMISLVLAAGTLSACSSMGAPLMAAAPKAPVQAQSDAGVRNAIRTGIELGFIATDTNKDSFISKEELKIAEADFAKADTNKDNKLSLKEYLYASNKLSQMAFQTIKQETYKAFTAIDRDRDGLVTLDEQMAAVQGQPSGAQQVTGQLFFLADRNRDRKLSVSEYEDVAVWNLVGNMTGRPMGATNPPPHTAVPIGPGTTTGPMPLPPVAKPPMANPPAGDPDTVTPPPAAAPKA